MSEIKTIVAVLPQEIPSGTKWQFIGADKRILSQGSTESGTSQLKIDVPINAAIIQDKVQLGLANTNGNSNADLKTDGGIVIVDDIAVFQIPGDDFAMEDGGISLKTLG